jgi:hypothetical protein
MKYLLIMGNTRVGSTWLSASMHRFSQVHCTREIRWMMPYQEKALQVHTYVDADTRSMKERLDYSCSDTRRQDLVVKGAKLKFDPYGFVPPEWFSRLKSIIEEDVQILFLRRPYIEIFGTWKSFGIRQLANQDILIRMQQASDPVLEDEKIRLDRFFSTSASPLEKKEIIIVTEREIYGNEAREYVALCREEDILHYPIEEAIDDLLVLFYNDVLALSLCSPRAARLLNYRDIRGEFTRLLSSLSIQAPKAECREALDDASTKRIEPRNDDLVRPSGALKEISEYLNSLFQRISFEKLRVQEVINYDPDREVVSFVLPALSGIFERHEETRALVASGVLTQESPSQRRSFNAKTGLWVSGRPVYHPLETAMPSSYRAVSTS